MATVLAPECRVAIRISLSSWRMEAVKLRSLSMIQNPVSRDSAPARSMPAAFTGSIPKAKLFNKVSRFRSQQLIQSRELKVQDFDRFATTILDF